MTSRGVSHNAAGEVCTLLRSEEKTMSEGEDEVIKRRDFGKRLETTALVSAVLGAQESEAEEALPQGE
jgi:hypothetical protein